MSQLIAYHGDPLVKALYQSRFEQHRRMDAVIQRTGYNEEGRGCLVGCTLEAYDHGRFPIELGWPEWLAELADDLFEGVSKESAPQFGSDLLEAAPVGADLEPVRVQFLIHIQRLNLRSLSVLPSSVWVDAATAAVKGVLAWLEGGAKDEARRLASRDAAQKARLGSPDAASRAALSAMWATAVPASPDVISPSRGVSNSLTYAVNAGMPESYTAREHEREMAKQAAVLLDLIRQAKP